MERDPRTYLADARTAAAITVFTTGKTYNDFANDLLLRSAVERQFQICSVFIQFFVVEEVIADQ